MKRIISTLGILALALSLGAPAFGATAARPQTQVKTTGMKSQAKNKTTAKKGTKVARKASSANAKAAAPQSK